MNRLQIVATLLNSTVELCLHLIEINIGRIRVRKEKNVLLMSSIGSLVEELEGCEAVAKKEIKGPNSKEMVSE